MTSRGRTLRRILALVVLAAIGWWIHETKPTVSELVDDLTRPLLGSRAVVRESEQKRVVGEASHVLTIGEEKPIGSIRLWHDAQAALALLNTTWPRRMSPPR